MCFPVSKFVKWPKWGNLFLSFLAVYQDTKTQRFYCATKSGQMDLLKMLPSPENSLAKDIC